MDMDIAVIQAAALAKVEEELLPVATRGKKGLKNNSVAEALAEKVKELAPLAARRKKGHLQSVRSSTGRVHLLWAGTTLLCGRTYHPELAARGKTKKLSWCSTCLGRVDQAELKVSGKGRATSSSGAAASSGGQQ